MFGISKSYAKACNDHFNNDEWDIFEIFQEECAEAIHSMSMIIRYGKTEDLMVTLKEEMSHVAICLAMVSDLFDIKQDDINVQVLIAAENHGIPCNTVVIEEVEEKNETIL